MYEQRASQLPFIQLLWRAYVAQEDEYDDPAKETWGLAFTRHADGTLCAELLGPSFYFKKLDGVIGDEYWGVEFYSYVTMRGVDKPSLAGKLQQLPVTNELFSIGSDSYKIPSYENLETFCEALARQGIISHTAHFLAHQSKLSLRTKQRKHRQTVGLTRKQLDQIKRAEYAVQLLKHGATPAEAALDACYADQAHMTRSLKLLLGMTPSQINKS